MLFKKRDLCKTFHPVCGYYQGHSCYYLPLIALARSDFIAQDSGTDFCLENVWFH